MERKRKSEKLTKEELSAFRKQFNSFHTKTDAEAAFGVLRQVLDMVSLKGSGSPDTIEKIRSVMGELAA